ncbi:helix-turn-helix domain-containing protein [Leptolyngbya sp. AN03gr2]|uniref:helix-turn-helix domain-containing protein n=1 Tax=unclassified Leptolyngbya TaxID=2650499 RepID=UPI003D322908
MTNGRSLGDRELTLLELYSNCQWSMDVFVFYQKWNVTQSQIAQICGCSLATVERWFSSQRQTPEFISLRKLAEMDLVWEMWEQIPQSIRDRLCS